MNFMNKTQAYTGPGDHGGLTLSFIDLDLVCSAVCPILLGQVKIRQRWHGNWANWWNFLIKVNTT